jgi:sialate O-acetylesterase
MRITTGKTAALAMLFLLTSSHLCAATVALNPLFSDNAVLQRNKLLPIWGTANPHEEITVTLGTASKTVKADERGDWLLTLPPQSLSTEPLTLTAKGSSTAQAKNILIGDVWLCSGQSNMGFSLGSCDAQQDVRSAKFPLIRHFGVHENFALQPAETVKGDWKVCAPDTAAGFSAVAFYFARRVHLETGVPIGLLRSSVGGTNIELWISQEMFMNTPALAPYAKKMTDSLRDYREEVRAALPAISEWTAKARAALETDEPIPQSPQFPEFPFGEKRHRPRCVTLHNGMIAPLIPFALCGVLWYQGENNSGTADDSRQYLEKMNALVSSWRTFFMSPKMPFYFVQLTAWMEPNPNPAGGDGWVYVREAQRKALERIPHSGMATTIDIGDAKDIHPKNKRDVGERLALWALRNEYGKAVTPSGPLFQSMELHGGVAKIHFKFADNGLLPRKRGDGSSDTSVQGFAIAGADKKWHWAEARIEGSSVVLSSPSVSQPAAVRYAFSNNPANANLYNKEGLPAAPFRTDDW